MLRDVAISCKEPCFSCKEPYFSCKEPYFSCKEPYSTLSLSQNKMQSSHAHGTSHFTFSLSASPPLSSFSHPRPLLPCSLPLTLSLSPSLAPRVHILYCLALSHPEECPYCQLSGTPTKSWLLRGVALGECGCFLMFYWPG